MKRVSSRAGILTALILAAGMVAACGSSYSPSMATQASLFEKYGGAATVSKVVDDAVVGLLADPVTAPFFAGLGKPGNSSPERLKSCLRLQLTAVLGGPATYPGRSDRGDMCVDMTAAHRSLGITGPVFDRFITDLAAVLKADGVTDADIATIAPVLTGLKPQVVTR
jgi:truncated hemoglobin YjbI